MSFFSVLIPTFNRADLLREALKSVFTQEFADYEVIVVDDGSTDETQAIVKNFGKRVKFFQQDHKGPGAARNLGIQNSNGDYVAFLDSDDLWFPWTLATYAQAIEQHGRPAIVAGRGVAVGDRDSLISCDPTPASFTHFADFLEASSQRSAFAGTPGLAIRTAELQRVGGFMEAFVNGEDQDLCLRLGTAAGFVRINAPTVFGQRVYADRVSSDIVKSLAGVEMLLRTEQLGQYPGGSRAHKVRREIVTATARSVSINAADSGRFRAATLIYQGTFFWHIQLCRFKYLFGFPIIVLMGWAKARQA